MYSFVGEIIKIWKCALLALLVLSQHTLSLPTRAIRSASPCDDPSNDVLEQQYIEYLSDTETLPHESWYMLPYLRNSISNETDKAYNINTELLSAGDTSCPAEHIPATNELKDRSNCPWYYELNMNDQRFPIGLPQAHCRCTNCLGSKDIKLGCDKVYYYVKVLRKTAEAAVEGVCSYRRSFEKIAVGCTCSRSGNGGNPES